MELSNHFVVSEIFLKMKFKKKWNTFFFESSFEFSKTFFFFPKLLQIYFCFEKRKTPLINKQKEKRNKKKYTKKKIETEYYFETEYY